MHEIGVFVPKAERAARTAEKVKIKRVAKEREKAKEEDKAKARV